MIDPRRSRAVALWPVLALLAGSVRGEDTSSVQISGEKEGKAAALRLAEARKKLDDHKWSEAIEELQSILNTAGNDLVSLTPTHFIRAGRLCQVHLAALPTDALRLYRQRYESQARKKLQQAQAERDVLQLRKIVEDSFCTRAAEKAIDLLGDLAFERGCFAEAEEWWRLLAPLSEGRRTGPPPPGNTTVVYPDPTLDSARLQAKQLLAQLFQGTDSEWTAALDAYRERHAKAEGTLAGRTGRYADVLHELAEERRKQGRIEREDWSTFGGDSSRGRVIPGSEDILDHLSALCGEGPTWRFSLEQRARQDDTVPAPAVDAAQARTLAFYPVILGHQVVVADARYVTAFDLRTGQSEQWYDVAGVNGGVSPNTKLPAAADLRYTLTAADERVYVRLGTQDIGIEAPPPPQRGGTRRPRRDNETFLACLSQRPDAQGEHFRWKIDGNLPRDRVLFEGAPVVAKGLIWIAATRNRDGNCVTVIDCYTTDGTSAPPLRWRCEVCETTEGKAGEPRYRHHLLTLAGTQIVYCTHTGAVVAVDALTGRRNWAIRYPRRAPGDEANRRDLTPVLFAAGRLYVAPADSDHLLCLDPATGRTLWELEPARVPILGGKLTELEAVPIVHLLGVGQGRLIFTTATGLRAVRADNGNPVWSVPDSGTLTPAGRGLLIGDLVLFPTTQQRDVLSPSETVVYALRQSDGRPADDPARLHRLPAGNLAYANGCLAVADRRTLSVFVPPRLLLGERQAAARHAPDSARKLVDFACAEADAAHDEESLRTLGRVEELLHREPRTSAVKKLLTQALRVKHAVLLRMAQRAAHEERWQDADNALEQAAAVPLSPRYRLHALLRAARIWEDAEQPEHSAAVWKTIRADESLRDIQMIDHHGHPVSVAARFACLRFARNVNTRNVNSLPSAPRRNEIPSLPLFRTWHVHLGSDEWILAGWQKCDPELLLTGSPDGRFRCRLTSTGDLRWQHRLPFAPCWATCRADTVLAGGEKGVSCLRRDNGELLWHFPAPVTGRYPRAPREDFHVVLDPQPLEPLTDFRLVAGRLFFLQGQRRLFAVNAETGAVVWDRWAPDGALRLPAPRSCFSPCYHAGAETVLVQASGRRWLLDAATGRLVHEAPDSRELWRRPPLQLDEHTLCVIPDPRQVVLLDARTGQSLWTHRAGDSTVSGELPSVLGRGEVLIYVQPANIGYYLHRLDPATGQSIWPRPLLLRAKTLDLSDWTFDSQALYGIEDRFLIARSLANGEVLWRRTLTVDGAWRARRIGDCLVLLPRASVADSRFRFRPPLAAIQWEVGSLLAPDAISPLSWYDPKTGQLVQRLNFRIEAPPRTAFGKRTIPQEDGPVRTVRTSSLLASPDGPAIHLATPQPFVALGGEVWGLTATRNDADAATSAGR